MVRVVAGAMVAVLVLQLKRKTDALDARFVRLTWSNGDWRKIKALTHVLGKAQ